VAPNCAIGSYALGNAIEFDVIYGEVEKRRVASASRRTWEISQSALVQWLFAPYRRGPPVRMLILIDILIRVLRISCGLGIEMCVVER